MHNDTRKLYEKFVARVAEVNHVPRATERFSVAPQAEERLVEMIQESSPFLSLINSVMVDNQKGVKVGVGVNSTIAGRTDTTADDAERRPRSISTVTADQYMTEQTDYDTYILYSLLDAWRHRPEFQPLLRATTSEQIAHDRLMIGWNGTHAAATTDRGANPLLEDVNIGWLQQLRGNKPAAVMRGTKIFAGAGADWNNIDAAVYDAKDALIEAWHQSDDLIVVCGRKLLSDKYVSMINESDAATERRALEGLMVNKMLGGLRTITVPFFPDDAFFITPLANLSIYTQRGGTRLYYADNPRKNRVEEFRSVNEAYVIEDYDACCLVEDIMTEGSDDDSGTAS